MSSTIKSSWKRTVEVFITFQELSEFGMLVFPESGVENIKLGLREEGIEVNYEETKPSEDNPPYDPDPI